MKGQTVAVTGFVGRVPHHNDLTLPSQQDSSRRPHGLMAEAVFQQNFINKTRQLSFLNPLVPRVQSAAWRISWELPGNAGSLEACASCPGGCVLTCPHSGSRRQALQVANRPSGVLLGLMRGAGRWGCWERGCRASVTNHGTAQLIGSRCCCNQRLVSCD